MKTNVNRHEVRIWYSAVPGDKCFVAQVVDLPGIMAHGASREAAAREIQLALDLALATGLAAGAPARTLQNPAGAGPATRGAKVRRQAKRRSARSATAA